MYPSANPHCTVDETQEKSSLLTNWVAHPSRISFTITPDAGREQRQQEEELASVPHMTLAYNNHLTPMFTRSL